MEVSIGIGSRNGEMPSRTAGMRPTGCERPGTLDAGGRTTGRQLAGSIPEPLQTTVDMREELGPFCQLQHVFPEVGRKAGGIVLYHYGAVERV